MNEKKKVLIVGGGFGGIKTALELAKDNSFEITLLSDRADFRYYPTLFHAVTAGKPSASSIPLSEIFAGKAVNIVTDEAQTLDRTTKQIKAISGKTYGFDQLIVALGVVTNFFGIPGLDKYSFGIKSWEEARRLHDHLHKLVVDEGKADLNYVIIGGGPTGVELAGALPSYLDHLMTRHGISAKNYHIDIVEAMPRLMPRSPESVSAAVTKQLQKLGVNVFTNQKVEAEKPDALTVSGHDIQSHTVVWTAGVTNHPFFKANNFKLSDHGKVSVNEFLSAEENIYVIGDNANTKFGGLAQTALYDAVFVSDNLRRSAHGTPAMTYVPKEPIYVTPAGPGWAAVQWGKRQYYGRVGWFLRKAADFMGYRDYEPWWRAAQHWLADNSTEETCPICSGKAKAQL